MSVSYSESSEVYSENEYSSEFDPDSDPDAECEPESCRPAGSDESSSGSYVNNDCGPANNPPEFKPKFPPGVQLPDLLTRKSLRKYLTPLSFFKLFFTAELMQHLCSFTNEYARQHGPEKPSLYQGWTDVTPQDLYVFMALLMYMAIVQAPNIECYWSTSPLFHGLWARHFMSKHCFKALQSFLKVCDPQTENSVVDKLSKVRFLHDYVRRKCRQLYQPYKNVSIDERMVRNRGRFTFRQFVKDKPTRWGMKLWVLADSKNGYTYDFEVYTGKGTPVSKNGIAYDVVMRLCKSLEKQGYHIYFDNFYTSVQLLKDLLPMKLVCCGTLLTSRKGVPLEFKDTKSFSKSPRGYMRWRREGNLLFLQWLDNKPVTFLSSIHKVATKFKFVKRRNKVSGVYRPVLVRQPTVVHDYSMNMSGVDKSDQYIGKYETLRKTHHWWKTLFFHFLDVVRVNSFILFNDFRLKNDGIPELHRPDSYNQLDFTVELIKEMGGVTENQEVPLLKKKLPPPAPPSNHPILPGHSATKRNCVWCYSHEKIERKTIVMCATCGKNYCFQRQRNCLLEAHQSQ